MLVLLFRFSLLFCVVVVFFCFFHCVISVFFSFNTQEIENEITGLGALYLGFFETLSTLTPGNTNDSRKAVNEYYLLMRERIAVFRQAFISYEVGVLDRGVDKW
jgi:hypothetical protein